MIIMKGLRESKILAFALVVPCAKLEQYPSSHYQNHYEASAHKANRPKAVVSGLVKICNTVYMNNCHILFAMEALTGVTLETLQFSYSVQAPKLFQFQLCQQEGSYDK